MEDHILIRYGELSLKKSNRKQFINKINANIKRALKEFSQLAYESRGLRFYIILNGEDSSKISEILKKIPGIYSFSVVSRCDSNINAIKEQALILVKKEFEMVLKPLKLKLIVEIKLSHLIHLKYLKKLQDTYSLILKI